MKQTVWYEHIRAWRASGLSQREYCARHGLKLANLGYWIARQRKQAAAGLTLVPLDLAAGLGPVLHSPNGWRLELPGHLCADWLADLLRRLP